MICAQALAPSAAAAPGPTPYDAPLTKGTCAFREKPKAKQSEPPLSQGPTFKTREAPTAEVSLESELCDTEVTEHGESRGVLHTGNRLKSLLLVLRGRSHLGEI